MLNAVEAAILTLLQNPPSLEHLSCNDIPLRWKSCHADNDNDGIFCTPKGMQATTPPVVVDGVNSGSALGKIGIFDRVRSVSHMQESNGSSSAQPVHALASSAFKDYQQWLLRLQEGVKQPKCKYSTRGAEQIWGPSQTRISDLQKKWRLD